MGAIHMMKICRIVFLCITVATSTLIGFAQDEPLDLNWDDTPQGIPYRHEGDWNIAMGWYAPDDALISDTPQRFDYGDQLELRTPSYDIDGSIDTFVLRNISERAYFWFEEGARVSEDELKRAAQEIDQRIIPGVDAIFNQTEAFPHRVHLIHNSYIGYGIVGMFRPSDTCRVDICDRSNEIPAVYYSLDWGDIVSDEYFTTIAHEYQHLLQHYQDGGERRWLNEGFSQVAEHILGFDPEITVGENLDAFMRDPSLRLDGWSDEVSDPAPYYGASYLFVLYLYERFGNAYLQELIHSPSHGLASIYNTLADENLSLDAVFTDWIIANYVNNSKLDTGQYGYTTWDDPFDIRVEEISLSGDQETSILRRLNQYGAQYWELPAGQYTLEFDGDVSVPLTEVEDYFGEAAWWSYAAESTMSQLTRPINLEGVSSATLTFDLWYRTEQNYDWMGVLVSVDDGATWKPLSGEAMRFANEDIPIDHYSGFSNGWLAEQIDLSAYTGNEILLRFQYITDGTFTYDGVLIDNLAIESIGWADDAESPDPEWVVEGFLHIPESVQQQWALAIVTDDVEILTLDAENNLQQTFDLPDGGTLIIGAMAPLTAQPTNYQLTVKQE